MTDIIPVLDAEPESLGSSNPPGRTAGSIPATGAIPKRPKPSPEEPNSSFSTITPTLQLAWDSTSLGALKLCPAYYDMTIRRGHSGGPSENHHLIFGGLYHSALELYDRLRTGTIDRRLYRVLRKFGADRQVCRSATLGPTAHKPALLIVLRFIVCATWDFVRHRPQNWGDSMKNRETLFRATLFYIDQFGERDPLTTYVRANGEPAVEFSFSIPTGITSADGEEFLLCGHMDKVVEYQDSLWIVDRKTTQSQLNEAYFSRYSPDNQMSLYIFAGNVIFPSGIRGAFIDGCQTLVGGNRYQRHRLDRTPSSLNEWHRDLEFWLAQAQLYAKNNYWPRNDKSCGLPRENPITGETEYGCPFRSVCAVAPEVREPLLKSLYPRRVWDPLRSREKGTI